MKYIAVWYAPSRRKIFEFKRLGAHPKDCVPNALEFLGVLTPQEGRLLRAVTEENGLHDRQTISILQMLYSPKKFEYSSLDRSVLEQVLQQLEPNQVVMVKVVSHTPLQAHAITFMRDFYGELLILEAQYDAVETLDEYLNCYNEFYLLTTDTLEMMPRRSKSLGDKYIIEEDITME